MAEIARVQAELIDWYARHGRDLPWRRTRDPYAILVAEVMLQQTQVERVIPKWHAWLERFPGLAELARASRGDAIRAWQGLGYNMRAARLHAIALQAVSEFGGQLPRSVEGLLRLKGVGRYTAGAVACFAYGQPVAMVDTNVRRVLGRVLGVEPSQVEELADEVVPLHDAYRWNQGLMDLGATLCRAREPLCLLCPLQTECAGPSGTASPRRPHGTFRTSNRYYRGRIVDELRGLQPGETVVVEELAQRMDHRRDLIERLATEGLLTIDHGRARLAD